MTQERDLLRSVARDPDDDAVRLVFADWLDDHGQGKRAEFIRGQVRLARMSEDSPERRELAFRCRQLLDTHEGEWRGALVGMMLWEWHWSRGFIEVVDHDPGSLEEYGERLFDTLPVRRLILAELFGKADALALIPADHRLLALDLTGNDIDLRALKKLVKYDHLGGLTELGLMFNRLKDSAVKFLCEEPFFQRLSLIKLGCNPFTERGRQRLRDHFGDRVSFARESYPDRLFTIRDDYLRVGWGRDFTQFLMVALSECVLVALFDHAGNLLRTEERPVPQVEPDQHREQEANRVAVRDAWLAQLGYQSATIKVKRFRFDSESPFGIFDYAHGWCEEFDRPRSPEIDTARHWLERWLGNDKFAFGQGLGDIWLDRKSGEVTDT